MIFYHCHLATQALVTFGVAVPVEMFLLTVSDQVTINQEELVNYK